MKSLLMTLLLTIVAAGSSAAEDWPQWRGPSRDCHIGETTWPESLDNDHLKKSWNVSLGPSYSGPIVVGDRVFVTETRDESHEVVRALDRNLGEELWKVEWPGAMKVPFFAAANCSGVPTTKRTRDVPLFCSTMFMP